MLSPFLSKKKKKKSKTDGTPLSNPSRFVCSVSQSPFTLQTNAEDFTLVSKQDHFQQLPVTSNHVFPNFSLTLMCTNLSRIPTKLS